MTLEEAIKAGEAEVLAYKQALDSLDENMPTDMREDFEKTIKKHIEYHRQLAEWLKELNNIKHLFNVTEKLFKANFRGGLIDVVDGYDILFSEHKQLREIFEEVNADVCNTEH